MFDTLDYTKHLQEYGIKPDVLSMALQRALDCNIYSKEKVNSMLSETMKELDERNNRVVKEIRNEIKEIRQESIKINNEMRTQGYQIIASLSAVVIFVGAVVSLINHI